MKIMELLKDHQTGQDETQLQSFVLGGRTPWGTYKQALRELYKRVRGLRISQTETDLLAIDIEEKQKESENTEGLALRRANIELRQLYGQMEEAERGLVDLKREAAIFWREANKLKLLIGEFTPERRIQLDREEWMHWHIKKGMIGKLITGIVPEVVLANLYSISAEERKKWLELLEGNPEKFIEEGEYGVMPLPPPSQEDIALLEEEIENDNLIEGQA
jgi:hypothetical protein